MLKSLELSGFKSFAKKTDLDFMTAITAIVGPNGSGKSNVAEAFRFVLGEQSIKSMRGKKGEDLIFNGSNKIPKMNRGGAKVIFDNRKRILNIDFDEVSIERVVHRDGINEYSINGSQVRLKDIIELLAGAHIGATGHHIISQGEADKILNANVRDRREMIEDALGLKIYQYKRQESARKLEKTAENIAQVESLRREIAPHLKFLRKQIEKLARAEVMKQELVLLYCQYFKRENIYLTSEKNFIETEKRKPVAELRALEEELTHARKQLEGMSDAKMATQLFELEGKIAGARHAKDTLTRDFGRVEGEIAGVERARKREEDAAAEHDLHTLSFKEFESLVESIFESIHEAEKTDALDKIKSLLAHVRESIKKFIEKNRASSHRKNGEIFKTELERLGGEKTALERDLSRAVDTERSHVKEYESIKSNIEMERRGGLEAEKNILRIMTRQNEINSAYASVKAREERHHIELADFNRDLTEAGHIAGHDAINFEDTVIVRQDKTSIGEREIAEEPRDSQRERRRVIERIKIRLEEAGLAGSADLIKEFKESEERDQFLGKEIEDLTKSSVALQALIDELQQKIDSEFKEGIKKINAQFQDFFALMFGGGSASLDVVEEIRKRASAIGEIDADGIDELSVTDETEVPEIGVEIKVHLPHKKIRGLEMLSGGERALTSIALIFAMSQVNPPPFLVLDETDAALDEANSRKYGDMIENLAKYSQLILITHNRETMSRAGILYGVTMGGDGTSKLLSIAFEEAVNVSK